MVKKANPADTSSNSYKKSIADGFIGFGFVLGSSNKGAAVNLGESREFIVGLGFGRRWIKWNGIGIDLYYKNTNYYLAQDSGKILPNNILHIAEKVTFDNFGGLAFDRFYFGSFFLDGGFYFDYTFFTKHVTWDNFAGSYGSSTTKITEKQLVFTNKFNYGLTFRIGKITGISFYFNYRLTNLFKSYTPANSSTQITYPELPIYVVGVVLAGH